MTWTYDPTTSVGYVRLRISDTDANRQVMSDEDIQAFLTMAGDSVPLAAAMALESIAMNELLCLKVVNLMGAIITDAASAAKQIREIAKSLRLEYATMSDATSAGFVTIEMVDDDLQKTEKYWKTVEAEGLS